MSQARSLSNRRLENFHLVNAGLEPSPTKRKPPASVRQANLPASRRRFAPKPGYATIRAYYETLHQLGQLHIDHEMAVRGAFQTVLDDCGKRSNPKLVLATEYQIKTSRGANIRVDGALISPDNLVHGLWEAKDEKDDLAKEAKLKLERGYPSENILFQAPKRIILYQGRVRVLDQDISEPQRLIDVVTQFFEYKAPRIREWQDAVEKFSARIPELAEAVKKTIAVERANSPSFVRSFEAFHTLCRQAINPDLTEDAVERMLVQHLLTERIFRKIFNDPDFRSRNVIAAEIEKVISELTKRSLNRDQFLESLDRYYHAIECNAENATGFDEKQGFLNTVYGRFFKASSPKEADTHGFVYTPPPIVNFMVRSVEEILQKEFGRSLGDKGVHILDPFVGTGNFITRIIQEIKTTALPCKYENELHCNEIMLLPYYIASMNIERAYFDRTDDYKPFPGICLVDTFELAEPDQSKLKFITAENAKRVKRQKKSPIFVIIGNPPYNAWQTNENDNNRNRKYKALDDRVAETYSKGSRATNKSALSDPYVKAIRWASDQIKGEGIVALVTNSAFLDSLAADSMRGHLACDFDEMFILDLGGNVRKNPKISGTTHNVFGIQLGVSINLFIRKNSPSEQRRCKIYYLKADEFMTRYQKYSWLEDLGDYRHAQWHLVTPDQKNNWLADGGKSEFHRFVQIGRKPEENGLFAEYTPAPNTARDTWVYSFRLAALRQNIKLISGTYNDHVARWKVLQEKPASTHEFVEYEDRKISWSRDLKKDLQRQRTVVVTPDKFRTSLYRPFTKQHLFFDRILIEEVYRLPQLLPNVEASEQNRLICVTSIASEKPFMAMTTDTIPNYHLAGAGCGTQVFPFYTYAEDGTHRRENITDWALEQFRAHYHDHSITKWDIFHYIYAVLHHPEYRERYAANLRRELPRIPFATSTTACHPDEADSSASPRTPEERPMQLAGSIGAAGKSIDPSARKKRGPQDDKAVFRALVAAGQRLAEIHVHYEQQPEYKLTKVEKKGEKLDYRVTKMKLNKDKTTLIYNQFLTLSGIPKETYDYRLGNRSALEWIIDQYQVSTEKRSGITNDPNRADDPQYILRLIGQVITVSLETVKTVRSLPPLCLPG
jgi:predicted helicase